MKTGFTNEAGYNLVGSAVQNGVRLIVVVTGLKNAKDRADDAKKLLDYGFKNFDSRMLFAEGQTVAEAKVYGGAQGSVSGRRQGRGQADGAARRQRQDRRQDGLHRTGPGAGAGRARRSATCRSGAATPRFSRCRCRPPKSVAAGSTHATRLRCRCRNL